MVIILQQTSDNGRRFISTVVEEDLAALAAAEQEDPSGLSSVDDPVPFHRDSPQGASSSSNSDTCRSVQSNCSSSFSLNSQHSISERSAIYKRRIDSLFGRQTKFNSFKPQLLEPFCIKIEDQNYRPRAITEVEGSSRDGLTRRHSHRETESHFKGILHKGNPKTNDRRVRVLERPKQLRLRVDGSDDDDEDDDDYQRIPDGNHFSSIVTDSLSNLSRFNQAQTTKNLFTKTTGNSSNQTCVGRNVTSVRITCDDEEDVNLERGTRLMCRDVRVRNEFLKLCDEMGENAMADKSGGAAGVRGSGSTPSNNTSAPCSSSSADILWRNGDYDGHLASAWPASSCPTDKDRFLSPNLFHGCDLRFSVEYLGSTPVEGNTTALEDLQEPLCALYANYLHGKNMLNGQLSITKDGLRFESPKLRLVNPFATIAVWAAIKFVARGDPNPTEFAFMPLISDPEGQDKGRLFGEMTEEFARIYRSKHDGAGGHGMSKPFRNPPLFACVMREATFSLDCHAFVCRCAEDAIVVAANLYQSLVDKMKTSGANPHVTGKREGESGYGTLTRTSPANHASTQSPSSAFSTPSCSPPLSSNTHCNLSPNGGSALLKACCSKSGCGVGNDRFGASQDSAGSPDGICSDSESLLIPVRPPRRSNKKSHGSERIGKSNLKRYNSEDSILLKLPQRRVSINKTRNCSQPGYRPQYIKNIKRVKISTPEEECSSSSSATDTHLSESIDQVLDRIINPGGMSFNDLKPSYQQLLLKIALTLTQDQLYQKSKDAMKKHQQLPMRGSGKAVGNGRRKKPGNRDGSSGLENEEQSQFLGAFLKSFTKITSGKMMSASASSAVSGGSGAASSSSGPLSTAKMSANSKTAGGAKLPSKLPRKIILKKTAPAVPPKPKRTHVKHEDASMMSFCSGCACDNCSEKCYCSLPSKQNVKILRIPVSAPHHSEVDAGRSKNPIEVVSAAKLTLGGSKTSCSPAASGILIQRGDQGDNAEPCTSSARTITTKVCGYDTDSCAGSEKCYCSLQRVKSNGLKIYNINLDTETSDTDTNSYDLEAFNPLEPTTTTSSSSNLKTVSTKSVEILSYHPARRLSYCSTINGNNSPGSGSASVSRGSPNLHALHQIPQQNISQTTSAMVHHQQKEGTSNTADSGSKNGSQRVTPNSQLAHCSNSSGNNSSPYFHSSPTPKGILCNSSYNKSHQQQGVTNKVRLVPGHAIASCSSSSNYALQFREKTNSDISNPKGKFLKKTLPTTQTGGLSGDHRASEGARASGAKGLETDQVISMKKTAEIAAMFKDLNLKPQMGSNFPPNSSAHQVLKYDTTSDNITPQSNSSTDFQASLGYLP